MTRRARLALGVLAGVVAIFLGLLMVFGALQRQLIYFPTRAEESELVAAAARVRLEPWRDRSGARIGWRTSDPPGARRVVVFHGNAGHALHRAYFADGFRRLGPDAWSVYLFEYPGYGSRPGQPDHDTIKASGRAAMDELLAADARPLFVVGESIGSGVASHLAGELPDAIAGLFLVTPFTSLTDVGSFHYPILPVRLLLREPYDNVEALKRTHCRLAVLLAGRDEVIPTRLGQQLHDGYAGPKRLWVQSDATHNTIDYDPSAEWWAEVSRFLVEECS